MCRGQCGAESSRRQAQNKEQFERAPVAELTWGTRSGQLTTMIGGGRQAVRYLSRGGGAGRGRRGRGRGGGGWGGRDGRASRPTMKLKTATAEDGGEVDEDVDKVVPVDKFGVARARDGDAEDANLTPSMALEKAIASLPPPIPTNVKEHEEFYKKRWQRRWPEWDTVCIRYPCLSWARR